jgi:diamine N-acetyltransferase
MIRILQADESDAEMIASLGRITFSETFGHLFSSTELHVYLEKTFGVKKIAASISKQHNLFGIAYWNDFPAGYYKIKLSSDFDVGLKTSMVQLQKIYVLKKYHDMQIGKQLMIHLLSLSEIKDFKTIWLLVLESNEKGIRFYEAHDFYKKEKRFFQIGSRNLQYDLMIKNF